MRIEERGKDEDELLGCLVELTCAQRYWKGSLWRGGESLGVNMGREGASGDMGMANLPEVVMNGLDYRTCLFTGFQGAELQRFVKRSIPDASGFCIRPISHHPLLRL